MSVDASIGLRIKDYTTGTIASSIKIIAMLIDNGWNIQRHGSAYFLPLGDNGDDANWTLETIEAESLMKILEEKELRGELIGVLLTWQDTLIGGPLFLYSQEEALKHKLHTPMSLGLSSDRKILVDYGFEMTDVNWYLEKLLPIFNQEDMRIEYFTYSEHI